MSASVLTAGKPAGPPPRAGTTVADVMRPATTTAGDTDHAAAAAYLMKHAHATALVVLDSRTGRPVGLITEADIARAVADGQDLDDVRIHGLMAAYPGALPAGTDIRDAAGVMLTTGHRQLPVAGDDGCVGIIEIADILGALPGAPRQDPAPARPAAPVAAGSN
jgi:CBS domain-containing protein